VYYRHYRGVLPLLCPAKKVNHRYPVNEIFFNQLSCTIATLLWR
jgi:hypothetical protein